MKTTLTTTIAGVALSLLITSTSEAQFSQLVNKAKATANKIANGSSSTTPAVTTTTKNKGYTDVYDFTPGDTVLFAENFSAIQPDNAPVAFKTNGSCRIITLPDINGKWLKLEDGAVYKFARLINMPAKFTLEYDVLAVADDIVDLDPFIFGFAVNNSVKSYIQDAYNNGGICTISLQYFNKNQLVASSSKTGIYLSTSYDLTSYANQVMHVAIAADGDHVSVYLDKTKIVDTQLFKGDHSKYFFMSAPLSSKNNAFLAVSNVALNGFKVVK